ncbi:MAG: iron ABC transporter permease, partial [Bdellovibrionales bacterium]|nr:iron ABC transporter permease [Bdellovibrionales bacterium]
MEKKAMLFILLLFVFFALIVALLLFGPVEIEPSQVIKILFAGDQGAVGRDSIFWNYRIPKMLTAIAAGGAMALSGLLMQTYFQNPLAGPFVLGINSGATLGVAAWIIGISLLPDLGWLSFSGAGGVIAAAVGAMATLIIVILLSTWVSGKATLLIVGLIFGYIANGLINVMVITSSSQELQSLLLWSLGSFTRVSGHQLVILLLIVTIGVALAITLSKRLNVMLLGDLYAISSGINIALVKLGVIVITGTLCGAVTALCG